MYCLICKWCKPARTSLLSDVSFWNSAHWWYIYIINCVANFLASCSLLLLQIFGNEFSQHKSFIHLFFFGICVSLAIHLQFYVYEYIFYRYSSHLILIFSVQIQFQYLYCDIHLPTFSLRLFDVAVTVTVAISQYFYQLAMKLSFLSTNEANGQEQQQQTRPPQMIVRTKQLVSTIKNWT